MIELKLKPKSVAIAMVITILVLTVLHVGQLSVYFYIGDPDQFDFIGLFDFDIEANLPSFYSSLALLYCGILLLLIGSFCKKSTKPFHLHWLGLAVIFMFLALDEAASLHEELGDLVEAQGWFAAEGFLYFAWVVPYGLLLVFFVLTYFRFLLHLQKYYAIAFVAAGSLFILGAVGIEIISASEADENGTNTIVYSVLYTIEELCEMLAIVLFAYHLMKYIDEHVGEIKIKFGA